MEITQALTLLYFSAQSGCDALCEILNSLAYYPKIVRGYDWLVQDSVQWDLPLILFYSQADCPSVRIESILARLQQKPQLSIFHAENRLAENQSPNDAGDFLLWPCNSLALNEKLEPICRHFSRGFSLPETVLLEELAELKLVGKSNEFLRVIETIRKMARCEAPVLIQGETGTGKEMTARAIHYLGARQGQPFIPINCGAIPDNLLENELFGHEKGAFTGAAQAQVGLVEQADGGTLFLDEIDTLSPKGQVSLLRFLQDQTYKPLGAKQLRKSDVRIITASNANLKELVDHNDFRQDLFFRVNILSLWLPPLRNRRSDIRLLAEYLIHKYSKLYHKPIKLLHPQVLQWMENYSWPGNIRELDNFIHYRFLMSEGPIIQEADHLGTSQAPVSQQSLASSGTLGFGAAKAMMIADFERNYLIELLRSARGNITQAAKRSCKDRRAFGRLLNKHGIIREDYL